MEKTVCFTGHRYIPDNRYAHLKDLLDNAIEEQIQNGVTCFRAGGALGFDTLAALCVLAARTRHPAVRLSLILPCPTQSNGWRQSEIALYKQIISLSDEVRYISDSYYDGVMHARNRALVDGAVACIAYLTHNVGGTAYTATYALKSGLEFINLADAF